MMLTPRQRAALASRPVAMPLALPAAVGGWNTRDALTAMAPTDAVVLDNWYPDGGGLTLRRGRSSFATGVGAGAVETLAEYYAASKRQLLAAGGGGIYNISAGGAAPAALASGFASNRWQTVNFNAKQFWVNGTDAPQIYDGTTMSACGFTGPTMANIIGVQAYKNRIYMWEKPSGASQSFWYGGLNSITGAMTEFPVSTTAQFGGNLMLMTGFSNDGSDGVKEFACFVMTTGEVLVYQGSDPSDATNFSLVARYKLGAPVNIRSVYRYGGDAYLTTWDDHVPLQQQLAALKEGKTPPRSKISGAVQAAIMANGAAFGWQILYYPKQRYLLCNVPNADGTFHQHIYNTSTDAWCRFTGQNASCWGLYNEALYFGGTSGTVYLADTGYMDIVQAISADCQQAWNLFDQAAKKQVKAVRPVIQSTGALGYSFGIGFDYGSIVVTPASTISPGGSPWDTSPWNTSPWSPDSQVTAVWGVNGGIGTAVGVRIKVSATQQVSYLRTDFRTEPSTGL